ncbi:MAG: bacteriophage adsorption protein, partial [Microvirga sp.]|nr:bacteriophage adsorption protein [Microvirga sp.]
MPDRLRHSRKIVLALMAVAALVDPVGDVRAQAAEELPLTGSAYESASQAYEAFSRGDYAAAVTKARDAIRQRPDVNRLRRLLVEALAASGDLEEADRTASGFVEA